MERLLRCEMCEHWLPDVIRREELGQHLCDECNEYEEKLKQKEELAYEASMSTSNSAEFITEEPQDG